ncbi:MAG TPA: hypothetical protein VGX23_32420 [Actinocrinis sp.]|nr:hypothetical protein [Actinocrinis sp.]
MPVAIGFSEYGPPEVLRPIEIDEPSAAPGEVRVRVKAAGIAPFDCRLLLYQPTESRLLSSNALRARSHHSPAWPAMVICV